jgi:hypothetical protein
VLSFTDFAGPVGAARCRVGVHGEEDLLGRRRMTHPSDSVSRRRRIVSLVTSLLGLAANLLRVIRVTSGTAIILLAFGYAAAGISYTLRWASHLFFFCCQRVGPETKVKARDSLKSVKLGRDLTNAELGSLRKLRLWVAGEFVAAVSWLVTAWFSISSGSSLLLFGASVITLVVVISLVTPIEQARRGTPLESASWCVEHSRFGQWLLEVLGDSGLDWLWPMVGDSPARGNKRLASSCIFVTLMAVAVIGLGSVYGAAAQVVRAVAASHEHHNGSGATAGKGSGASKSASAGASTITNRSSTTPGSGGGAGSGGSPPACQSAVDPSRDQHEQLDNAISVLGLAAAGKVGQPESVSGPCGTWVTEGTCTGKPWSLTVAPPSGATQTLIGTQATEVGLQFVNNQSLIAVTQRLTLSSGEAYGLQTTRGTYVMIRRHSETRAVKGPPPRTCTAVPATAVLYQVMPPQLAGLWLTMAQSVFTWPVQTGSTATGTTWKFMSDEPNALQVARGGCTPAGCWITKTDGTQISLRIASAPAALESLANEEDPP